MIKQSLAFLAVISLSVCGPSFAAASAVDLPTVEAAVRKADADWAAAASTANVDAWMAFYSADAAVLLPNDRFASGRELIRHTVSQLLTLPDVLVAWHPIKVDVVPSGDQALVIETFELRYGDSRGTLVSDRGRRLEIWRKQADGTWKCSVDTWNLAEPVAAPTPAHTTGPVAGSGAPLAASAQLPAAASDTGPPRPVPATKYGDEPADYERTIRKYFLTHLKYPDSIQYQEITKPEQGYTTAITGTLLMRETRTYGWRVKATINAKNSSDVYVGFKTYTFLFRGEKIVDTRAPLPQGEMGEPTPG